MTVNRKKWPLFKNGINCWQSWQPYVLNIDIVVKIFSTKCKNIKQFKGFGFIFIKYNYFYMKIATKQTHLLLNLSWISFKSFKMSIIENMLIHNSAIMISMFLSVHHCLKIIHHSFSKSNWIYLKNQYSSKKQVS